MAKSVAVHRRWIEPTWSNGATPTCIVVPLVVPLKDLMPSALSAVSMSAPPLVIPRWVATNDRFAAHRAGSDQLCQPRERERHPSLPVLGGLIEVSRRMRRFRPLAARAADVAVAIDEVVVVGILRDAEVDNDVFRTRPGVRLAAPVARGHHLPSRGTASRRARPLAHSSRACATRDRPFPRPGEHTTFADRSEPRHCYSTRGQLVYALRPQRSAAPNCSGGNITYGSIAGFVV
jgi:hypothetical protein